MNEMQARARLKKLIGINRTFRDDKTPSNPEQRTTSQEEWERLKATDKPQDPIERKARQKLIDTAQWEMRRYRYTAGRLMKVGPFGANLVLGQADTLQALIEDVEKNIARHG